MYNVGRIISGILDKHEKIFSLKIDNVVIGLLVFATLASGGILASVRVKADNTTVVD